MLDRWMALVLTSVALASCGGERGEIDHLDTGADRVVTVPSVVVTKEEAVAIGDSAAMALTGTLMSRVRAELEQNGAAAAIAFCSERALPLTAAVEDSLGRGISVKRTSMRLRNPANAPDSLERVALSHFTAERESGSELSSYYLQRTPEGWRYYKPISVAPLCTACHGPVDAIDPAVRQVLAERYPDDRATGYAAGDFRGVIRVAIPATLPPN